MDARRARGGARYRASRIIIVLLTLMGIVLITPAPVMPLHSMAIVDYQNNNERR